MGRNLYAPPMLHAVCLNVTQNSVNMAASSRSLLRGQFLN